MRSFKEIKHDYRFTPEDEKILTELPKGLPVTVLINKVDLAPFVGADLDRMQRDMARYNPKMPVFRTNLKTGDGVAELLDAILTGRHPAGTVLEFSQADFHGTIGPSPHYAGLPEVLRLADCLAIPVPADLCVLAMEVEDPYQIREGLSRPVDEALSSYVLRARQILDGWQRALRIA